jgi:hypothetical protein
MTYITVVFDPHFLRRSNALRSRVEVEELQVRQLRVSVWQLQASEKSQPRWKDST